MTICSISLTSRILCGRVGKILAYFASFLEIMSGNMSKIGVNEVDIAELHS
jgi:hypothetical protein